MDTNNTIAGNELADTLENLLLDIAEGYNTQPMNSLWPTTVSAHTPTREFVQEALAAIHVYRVRTGTQRVRPVAARAN